MYSDPDSTAKAYQQNVPDARAGSGAVEDVPGFGDGAVVYRDASAGAAGTDTGFGLQARDDIYSGRPA